MDYWRKDRQPIPYHSGKQGSPADRKTVAFINQVGVSFAICFNNKEVNVSMAIGLVI